MIRAWVHRFRRRRAFAPGEWGEGVAERMLCAKHYRILGRRVRVGRRDEIDIVARSPRDVLVFVEVKTRADESYGRPIDAVNRRKRHALCRAAIAYLRQCRPAPRHIRFDVVEVVGVDGDRQPVVRHIESAFTFPRSIQYPWASS